MNPSAKKNLRALRIHQIELVVNAREGLGNGGGVGNHAHGTLDIGKVAARHNRRRLVVDTTLETGRAPIYKLKGEGREGRNVRLVAQ